MMCVALTLLAVPILALGQIQWIAVGRPFEPFFLAKIDDAEPCARGRQATVARHLVHPALRRPVDALFWSLHMGAIRDRITLGEPWMTALFAVVGIAYLLG